MSTPPILAYENLGLQMGSGWLFEDINLYIGPRDRLALIGRNGAGKTTMMRLIAGDIDCDKGLRTIIPGTHIVMLEQDPDFSDCETLIDFTKKGDDPPAEYEIRALADQIGIDLDRPAKTASGGEKRRAAICLALALKPDLLLLDEPTNHLDLAAIEWLENYLGRFNGAFVVISHDRAFLTNLTKQTFWLDRGTMRRSEIGFGGYDAWMEKIHADEEKAAHKLDAKLKLENHWLVHGVTARRKRNQGRLEKLYEMREQRKSMVGPAGTAKLAAATNDVKTKTVIDAKNINKSYGDRALIKDFTLRIQRGDRIGIVGANGTGKTTLIRILTGEDTPDSGEIRISQTLEGIVIDQQRKLLEPQKQVRDILADGSDWIDVRGVRKHVQGYLKEFLFDPALINAKVGTLSGGEKSRLLLAREFARASNLLVLDEPTNDLDLETLDLLQEVISDYEGTVLLVSHDRDFLNRTVNLTLGLDGSGEIDIIVGGYGDWVKKRPNRNYLIDKNNGIVTPETKSAPKTTAPQKKKKLSYKDQRDYDLLPKQIEQYGKDIIKAEAEMSDPKLYSKNFKRFEELSQLVKDRQAAKDAAEERWLEIAEMTEELQD